MPFTGVPGSLPQLQAPREPSSVITRADEYTSLGIPSGMHVSIFCWLTFGTLPSSLNAVSPWSSDTVEVNVGVARYVFSASRNLPTELDWPMRRNWLAE